MGMTSSSKIIVIPIVIIILMIVASILLGPFLKKTRRHSRYPSVVSRGLDHHCHRRDRNSMCWVIWSNLPRSIDAAMSGSPLIAANRFDAFDRCVPFGIAACLQLVKMCVRRSSGLPSPLLIRRGATPED